MASTSTSSDQKSFKYDVFLSFRGEDTRKNFVDHLYHALQRKSIITYRDDEQIKKGRRIGDDLMRSIEDSKFYIIVFSKNYASSSWCLDELVKIMECQKTNEQTAYPVFYDVEPTEVRKQCGAVGEAFAKHEEKEVAGKWRDALREAADLAGWELKNTFDGHEAKFIQKIVGDISLQLSFTNLRIDENLVGMEDRVKTLVQLLEIDIDDIRMIGIKGMGGAGKTTLAKAVFDHISFRFEGSSFVQNVRETSGNPLCGFKWLQKQILSDVLNDTNITVNGVSDFKNVMKKRMCGIKVLVVLDDVDHIDQLEALAGELKWFKPGSRVIITTREEQVLIAHGVPNNLILDVSLLSGEEANCLFNRYAFSRVIPNQGYENLSSQVVRYAAGLPLTIKVLGSFLRGKDELEWIDALERLKTIPLKETLEKLELSYNGLEDDYKEIFLDVACILKGWDKEEAIVALESCGFHARSGLRVLQQKSLLTVSMCWSLYLDMHDHIEEMGQNIVRRLHPDEPSKHTRLWIEKEVHDILVEDKGSEATRCIKIRNVGSSLIVMKGLRNMKKLRFLDIESDSEEIDGFLIDDFDYNDSLYLPNSLRYLRWNGYPFTCLPKKFQANNLVGLKMDWSNIIQLWGAGEKKELKKLRFIDLNYCKMRTLDIGLIPNLETLKLRFCDFINLDGQIPNLKSLEILGCTNLLELHMPIECIKLETIKIGLSKLKTLNLYWTRNLKSLKLLKCEELLELHMPIACIKLETINIHCSKLKTLILTRTRNLKSLNLLECEELLELHMPIECIKLETIDIHYSKLRKLNLHGTRYLKSLNLTCCKELQELFMPIESPELRTINIRRSKLITLNLSGTRNLERLDLELCEDLQELRMPDESLSLKSINIRCSKLITLNLSGTRNLERLDLELCEELQELCMPDESLSLKSINILSSKLKTIKLGNSPYLECLDLHWCFTLEEISALVGCRSGSVRFRPFWVNQGFCMVGSLAELHLEVSPFGKCPVHPDNNSPEFRFEFTYRELMPLSTRNLEKLSSFGFNARTNLASLSGSICGLQSLRKLTLDGGIPEVPKEIEELKCLEELILLSTNVKYLPDSICMLKHLKVLHLISCWFLKQLPEDLGRLGCLEELCLTDCKSLRDIPNSICEMKCLKLFHLTNCTFVEKLPKEMGRLTNLKELKIEGTRIIDLPESLFQLEHLRIFP